MADVTGLDAALARLDEIAVDLEASGAPIVQEAAAFAEAAIKANFDGSHKKGKPHVGGDKPNVVSGTLRRSVKSNPVRVRDGVASTTVGPTTVYGRRVELGYGGSRGYPYVSPVTKAMRSKLRAIALRRWRAVIEGK